MAMETTTVAKVPITRLIDATPPGVDMSNAWISCKIWFERVNGAIVKRPTVLYFHGSGAVGYPADNDAIIITLYNMGYTVVAVRSFNSGITSTAAVLGESSHNPLGGYGNVNSPIFDRNIMRNAITVQSAIEFMRSGAGNIYSTMDAFYLFGHSAGATSIISWSSISRILNTSHEVAAIFANGVAQAGLGNFRWNNVSLVMQYLSSVMARTKHPIMYCWGNNDDYCPPDVHRRLQTVLRENAETLNYEIFSPGNYTHSWLGGAPNIWGPKVQEFFNRNNTVDYSEALFARRTGTYSATDRSRMNTLMRKLIDRGIWGELDCLQLYSSGDNAADSLMNIVADHSNGVVHGNVIFERGKGFRVDVAATGTYIDTNFNGVSSISRNAKTDASMFLWVNNEITSAATNIVLCGALSSGGWSSIGFGAGTPPPSIRAPINMSTDYTFIRTGIETTKGIVGVIKTTDDDIRIVQNGFQLGSTANAVSVQATAVPVTNVFVFGRSSASSTHVNACTGSVGAFVFAKGMTVQKSADLYFILNEYMNSVGNV